MTDNSDLREQAAQAIANYIHHELFDIGGAAMMPWIRDQGDQIMQMLERAIAATKVEGKRRGLIP